MRGETEIVMVSDRAYTLKSAVTMTVQDVPRSFAMNLDAAWLSDDCGSVKPTVP